MNMQTEAVAADGRATTSRPLRVSRDLPSRSGVGAMFVNRTATGDLAGSDDWNRTWGLDGRFGVGEKVTVGGFAARTETPGLAGREHAWNVASQYDDGKTLVDFDYGVVGEDFNPEVGYLENTLRLPALVRARFRRRCVRRRSGAGDFASSSRTSTTRGTTTWTAPGSRTPSSTPTITGTGRTATSSAPRVNGTWEGLDEPFEVYPGIIVPAGRHGGLRFTLRSQHRPAQVALRAPSVGHRPVPDRQPEHAHVPGDHQAGRDGSRWIRPGPTGASICRRGRSGRTWATCASPTTSRRRSSRRA